MTKETTKIALVNNTGSANAHAYITGLDLSNDNKPLFIQADGTTVYHPSSSGGPQEALAADVAIPLGAVGATTTCTIPRIAGGRIWFAIDDKLTFLINPGPAIVEPSVTNKADPNYNSYWGFCEFTFNEAQLFVNISYVDFVALPIALELKNESGDVQKVGGLQEGGLDTICTKLQEQDDKDKAGWSKLIIKGPDGKNVRALSPNSGKVIDANLFNNYYQSYVDSVWDKYKKETLTINTQASWGDVAGKVVDNKLTFEGAGSFAQPSAADIFSCSTGPFGNYTDNREEMGALGARIAAAFNRSTLLVNSKQPEGEKVSTYYTNDITNHYARIVHETNDEGRGYAFPYDDVSNDQGDQAGTVFDGAPSLLTVTIGSPLGTSNGGNGNNKKTTTPVKKQPVTKQPAGDDDDEQTTAGCLPKISGFFKQIFGKKSK